jgi:hypothetical protein
MEISKISTDSRAILDFLNGTDLKPDEKIAALDTASATIRSVIGAEVFRLMWTNVLDKKR